jgi:hypothetical protein
MRLNVTPASQNQSATWQQRLNQLLPVFGHRNWVVVADSAYPSQSNPGIETIFTAENHIPLLGKVLDAITAQKHVRANVYLDAELALVSEKDAPGVTQLRREINLLLGSNARVLDHEQIIARLDASAKLFNILILKSTLTIPYTSVFLELDCGYWNPEAEKRLRNSVANPPGTSSDR